MDALILLGEAIENDAHVALGAYRMIHFGASAATSTTVPMHAFIGDRTLF
jgi:hypothetical protein